VNAIPYGSSAEHIAAEIGWLDQALLTLVRASASAATATANAGGHGWFVSLAEAEAVLASSDDVDPGHVEILHAGRRLIDQRQNASEEDGMPLLLPRLSRLFSLGPVDQLLLVACLASELDGKYARVYGCLHDDLSRKRPSVSLIRRLARFHCASCHGSVLPVVAETPAFRWELVQYVEDGLALDARIAAFLLEQPAADARIQPFVRTVARFEAAGCYDAVERTLKVRADAAGGQIVVNFHGPAAADGEAVARRVCADRGLALLHADLGEMLHQSQSGIVPFRVGLKRVYREALLLSAGVYFSGVDRVIEDPRSVAHLRQIEEALRQVRSFTCFESERPFVLEAFPADVAHVPLAMEMPPFGARRLAWRAAVGGALADEELDALAARCRYTCREIESAVALARSHADVRNADVQYADVVWASRGRSSARLGSLARVVTPRARWDELVLPEETMSQLREICVHVRQRPRVLHEWGFDRRLTLGKGLYALFVGPSGTGKTLAAEVIAGSLGLDLVRVDLAAVVSKYIGETEKNLDRIFRGAEGGDVVLFFDEADALFGRRSEIKDAHDRYANIEVDFLLQRLEQYEGVVVLASNLAQNIDESFTRRMQFTIDFPFPNEPLRLAIWRNHFPAETPLERDLDFSYLAHAFKIAGGNIRKIVLNAAFLAADEGGGVGMKHLLQATRREYERMGKLYPGRAS
jgi:hypothetical protein